jgi:hypothetical protein
VLTAFEYWAIARFAPPRLTGILGTKLSSAPEETMMMQHTTVQALGQARLAELHQQAQRAALARAARQARRARRQQTRPRGPGILAAATAWASPKAGV